MDGLERSSIAAPVLKDKRAYWLYQIPIIGLTAIPLLVVLCLWLLSWAGVQVGDQVVTIMGTLAATALGGLVNMITTGGSNNGQQ